MSSKDGAPKGWANGRTFVDEWEERERLKVLARVKRGELNLKEAAELLSVSYRQCRRLHKRHEESGDRGLVHRNRGRPSNRGHEAKFKQAVLARYQERYPDFGPTLAVKLF
jgi:molybdenum-dependent DNA-binding transcriptional regulator ModE